MRWKLLITMTMVVGLAVATGVARATTPASGGEAGGTLVAINTSAGDQTEPHVSGDLVAYTNVDASFTSTIHYYDFLTGDHVVPVGAPGDNDFLSDVDGHRIVFSRSRAADGTLAAMLFDTASGVLTELDPTPGSQRFGAVIGGNTVAYSDLSVGAGDIFAYDLGSQTASNLSQSSSESDGNPAVSPGGDVVVWERCVGSTCGIYRSVKTGSGWGSPELVSDTTSNEGNPDTDGTTVVYDSDRPSATGQDIYFQPVGGGPETQLSLAGPQRNPSISNGVVAFESFSSEWDIYVYVIATNILYRVTDTSTLDETLNDVTVIPSGAVRVAWAAAPLGSTDHDIYTRTFTVPLTSSTFSGYFAPLDNPPVVNVAKGGQAIPVKFSLGGNQGLDIFASGYPISQQIACDSSAPLDNVEQTVPAGSSSLSYDATTDQYTYVWKTDKAWAKTCRQLIVRLSDGSDHVAYFKFG
jgi:hypothetical protein